LQLKEGQILNFVISDEKIRKLKSGIGKGIIKWQHQVSEEKTNSAISFIKGVPYLSTKKYKKAFSYFKKTILKDSQLNDAHLLLDTVMLKSDTIRYNEAIMAYKQAIRTTPDFTEIHYWIEVE